MLTLLSMNRFNAIHLPANGFYLRAEISGSCSRDAKLKFYNYRSRPKFRLKIRQ